jgi:HEAT repeat protein
MDRVLTVLQAPKDGVAKPRAQLVAKIVELGPSAVPEIFRILSSAPEENRKGEQRFVLVEQAEEILFESLGQFPAEAVVEGLRSRATGEASISVRLVAMRILGAYGNESAVDLWAEMLADLEPIQILRPFVAEPSERALESILRRNDEAVRSLTKKVDQLDRPILPLVARAIGKSGDARGLSALERMLGRDVELDLVVIEQITGLAPGAADWRVGELLELVRMRLNHEDWRVRRAVCAALGRCHDVESFEAIVHLLGDENRRVSASAMWALQAMSGLSWEDADSERWLGYYREQRERWQAARLELKARLDSGDSAEIAAALRELSRMKLFRHEAAQLVLPALSSSESGLVRMACQTLAALDSPQVLDELLGLLRSPDSGIRAEAAATLTALTGRSLPADYAIWRQHLRG